MKHIFRWATGLTILSALPFTVYAEDATASHTGKWHYSASIGVANWPALTDVQSTSGGGFDSSGYAIELGAHKAMWQIGSADVLLGLDLGLFANDGDISGTLEELTQRGLYLTPSVKFRFGEFGHKYVDVETGIGYYETDFAELNCDVDGALCFELDDPYNSSAVGGYLGVTAGFGHWFTTGLKVHFADFGSVGNVPGVSGSLSGPIYVLSIGGTFGG